ncbi:MAG TPA: hypothetical protein VFU14_19870 [Acidimicrobiales bacterium]|nr:hypothetical protein [Acidimicrobiales bacterium]
MTESPDPFDPPVDPMLAAWAADQAPPLARFPHAAARVAHAALNDELAAVDDELEVLCARRRAAVDGLVRLRPRLWPAVHHKHGRRRGRVDEVPLPPIPPGAIPVGGTDLRAVCVGLLRRHGPCALRELHGLLHRYGYRIDSDRPVQRLADAMAYEVAQERCRRIVRGVYAAVGEEPARAGTEGPSPVQPLPWSDPDRDRPQVDPVVIDDPERWSGGAWPSPDEPPPARTAPGRRYPASTLDEAVLLARQRAAALARSHRPPQPGGGAELPGSAEPPEGADTTATPSHPPRWERFVDESFPTVERWASLRRLWEERRRRREQEGPRRPWEGFDDDA